MELELDFTAFKKNLRDLIESRGLYSKDIAAEINVSTPTLSRYLQGVRRARTQVRCSARPLLRRFR